MQRREYARYRLWFPVQVAAGGQVNLAMNQNIGAGGMLVALAADLKIDDIVSVAFRLPTGEAERSVNARVVRIEPNSEDPDGAWPFKVGLAFDELAPDLIPYLEEAMARFGG